MIRSSLVFIGLIIFISCGNKDEIPSDILKPVKMQAVLWDVIKADAFTTGFIKNDSVKNAVDENLKLQQQIFAIHHISKIDFYKSYDYYKTHTTVLSKMLDSIITQAGKSKKIIYNPSQKE